MGSSDRARTTASLCSVGASFREDPVRAGVAEAALRRRWFGTDPPMPSVDRYQLRGRLGHGAHGDVFSAWDPDLARTVAIKLIRAGDLEAAAIARFVREANVLARLCHPHVVPIFDVGAIDTADGPRAFFVMEHVDGGSLRTWLATPRPWRAIVQAFLDAGRGLMAAHAEGLIHRDFKPANVLIGCDGRIRVADFGLASTPGGGATTAELDARSGADSSPSHAGDRLTATGFVVGTPRYMAPEQHDRGPVDHRCDQFALCAALYEAVHGVAPFGTTGYHQLVARKRTGAIEPPTRGSSAPRWLTVVLRRGMSPSPADRYPDTGALVAALQRGLHRHRQRRRTVIATVGLVGAAWLASASAADPSSRRCDDALGRVDSMWHPARRDAIGSAFAASGREHLIDQWARDRTRVDEWVVRWQDAVEDACATDDVEPVAAPPLACLDERLQQLDAVLTALSTTDVHVLIRSSKALAEVRWPERCAEASASVGLAALGMHAEAELHRLDALHATGQWPAVIEHADALVEEAERGDDARLLAAALLRRGAALDRVAAFDRAQRDLERAYFGALEVDDPALATKAAGALVLVVGSRHGDSVGGARWAEHAHAALARAPDPAREGAVLSSESTMALAEGDEVQALELARRALSRYEQAFGPEAPQTTMLAQNLGVVLVRMRRYAEASEVLALAVAGFEASVGPNHPDLAMALGNLGTALGQLGDHDTAIAHLERARATAARSLGDEHPLVAGFRSNLALERMAAEDYVGAVAELEASLVVLADKQGREHPDVLRVATNLGVALALADRSDEALARLHHTLSLQESALGADHPDLAATLESLAEVEQQRGARAAAIDHFERALEIYTESSAEAGVVAECRTKLEAARRGASLAMQHR